MSASTDQGLGELMERYLDGDRTAFQRMHRRLVPRLRGLLFKLVHDEPTVDDLLQLTLLRAHVARDRFVFVAEHRDGAVPAWYFAIARNVALDHLRRHRVGPRAAVRDGEGETDIAGLADAQADPETSALEREMSARRLEDLQDAIAQLPETQREVVELHKLRGLSMAEVAERLALREGAVRVRAHRAYRALARLMGAERVPLWFLLWWSEGPPT